MYSTPWTWHNGGLNYVIYVTQQLEEHVCKCGTCEREKTYIPLEEEFSIAILSLVQRSSIKNYSEESEKKIYDVKVLHVTEIKDYVLRQLIRILPFQPSLKNQCYTIDTRSERNQRYYNEQENKCNQMVQQKSQQVFN